MIEPASAAARTAFERLRAGSPDAADRRNRDQVCADQVIEPVIRGDASRRPTSAAACPASGPQTLKSKLGTPSAERSMPKTSQITPNSKIGQTVEHQRRYLFNCHGSILSHGVASCHCWRDIYQREHYCHDHCTDLPDPDRPVRGGRGAELGRPSLGLAPHPRSTSSAGPRR